MSLSEVPKKRPDETRIALVGDVHFSESPPASRKDDYADTILAKLEDVKRTTEEHGVDAVVFSGDIFHRRTIGSLEKFTELVSFFRWWRPATKVVLNGNHDLSLRTLALSGQPLDLLFSAGVAERLDYGEPFLVNTGNGSAVMLIGKPYIREPGVEYFSLTDEEKVGTAPYRLMVTHATLLPPAMGIPSSYLNYDKINPDVHVVFNGHIHEGFAPWHNEKTWFINPGSIARVSRSDRRDSLKYCIASFSGEGAKFYDVPVACEPADVVFSDKVLRPDAPGVSQQIDVDRIVSQIQEVNVEAPWETMEIPDDVRETVEYYLSAARSDTV